MEYLPLSLAAKRMRDVLVQNKLNNDHINVYVEVVNEFESGQLSQTVTIVEDLPETVV